MVADRLGESWDRYDRAGRITGTLRRGEPIPAGAYHLCVAGFVFDGAGRVVLQRRSPAKLSRPGAWDCSAGGSALAGEKPQQAIIRETREELGLRIAPGPAFATVWHSDWFEVWFAATVPGLTAAALQPQTAEVAAVALLPLAVAARRLPRAVAVMLTQAQA